MCNLYQMTRSIDEIANLFRATVDGGSNAGDEIYPGYPGIVIADVNVRSMTWGFPLTLKGKSGQPLKPKAVNNARSDKLDSFMWRASFEKRRCLIPMTAFAEAEGPKGSKTRTWFTVPGEDVFACAGIWRDSDEWGLVYSMVMTDASDAMQGVHDRMPVILGADNRETWLTGTTGDAQALCCPWEGDLALNRTDESWRR